MLDISSTLELSNGLRMPLLGLGTYKTTSPADIERAIGAALEVGYRNIDTASFYGNEEGVGRAVRASGLPREEVFVSTKVWNDEQGYEGTLAAFDRSLRRLDLEYVDLYLVHWPIPVLMQGTWRAMEELFDSGRVRSIGVCNHLLPHLEQLGHLATVPPMVNQIEHHPWLQQPELVSYCRDRGIVVEAWGPIMRGRIAEEPELEAIALKHGVSPAQVALRWLVQRGIVAIPKSVHPARVRENADIFGFELTPEDMRRIFELDRGERLGRHPDDWL